MSVAPLDLSHVERDRLGHHASKLREQGYVARRRAHWNWFAQRRSDLNRIIAHRIGPAKTIPQTDDAELLIFVMARHLRAECGDDAIWHVLDDWCREMAPWVAHGAADVLAPILRQVAPHNRDLTARALGNMLRVTWEERCALGLRTIRPFGMSETEFRQRRDERKRALDRETAWSRRRDAGQPTWAERSWQSRMKPWELIGYGRRSWEVAKGKGKLAALVARARLEPPGWVVGFAAEWDAEWKRQNCAVASRLPEGSRACDATAQTSALSASSRRPRKPKGKRQPSSFRSEGTGNATPEPVAATASQEGSALDDARGPLMNFDQSSQHEEDPDAHRHAA